jgi:hypothetical protein
MSSTARIPAGGALFSADFSRQARGLAEAAIARIPTNDALTPYATASASSTTEAPGTYNGPWNGLQPIDGVDMARFYGAAASYRAAGGRNAKAYAWRKLGQFISETVAALSHPASERTISPAWDGQQPIPYVNMARLQQVAIGYRTAIGRAAKKQAWRKLGEFLAETLAVAREAVVAIN